MVLSTPHNATSCSSTSRLVLLPLCHTPKKKDSGHNARVGGGSFFLAPKVRSTRRNLVEEEFRYITPRASSTTTTTAVSSRTPTKSTIPTRQLPSTSNEGSIATPQITMIRKRGGDIHGSPRKKNKKAAIKRTDHHLPPLSPSLLFPFLSVEEMKLLELPSIPDSPRGVTSLMPRTRTFQLQQRSISNGLAPRVLF